MAYPPNNQIRIREGKVTPITVPEDQLQQLKEILNSNKYTPSGKETMIKQVMGGNCCVCGKVPSMQVTYSLEGASKIERYCDRCIKNVFAREAVL